MLEKKERRRIIGGFTKRLIAVAVLLSMCSFALVAVAASSYTVNVKADGKAKVVKTSSRDPETIVNKAGFKVGADDKIDTSAFKVGAEAKDGNTLRVYREARVAVYENGTRVKTLVMAGKVKDAIKAAGVQEVRSTDTVNQKMNAELEEGMQIKVNRSYTVSITADSRTRQVIFNEGTVQDALNRAGIKLGKYDTVKPSAKTKIQRGQQIVVKRVVYKKRTSEETIKAQTVYQTTTALAPGATQVKTEGSDGKKVVTYQDKYVDGQLKSSKVVSTKVTKEPVDRVVLKGASAYTNGLNFTTAASVENPLATIHGSSTAYTASAGARCSTGVPAKRGYVAVDPRKIPYGSKLYIKADDGTVYGYAIAADTGGFVSNSNTVVDLYMNSQSECVQWGRRNVTIYVLEWGNGTVS